MRQIKVKEWFSRRYSMKVKISVTVSFVAFCVDFVLEVCHFKGLIGKKQSNNWLGYFFSISLSIINVKGCENVSVHTVFIGCYKCVAVYRVGC